MRKYLLALMISITFSAFAANDDSKKITAFAKCLSDNGIVLYSAWWCPYCKELRESFGEEAYKELRVVECSNPNERALTEECREKGIRGVPTWQNAKGEQPTRTPAGLEQFFANAGCPLPKQ